MGGTVIADGEGSNVLGDGWIGGVFTLRVRFLEIIIILQHRHRWTENHKWNDIIAIHVDQRVRYSRYRMQHCRDQKK